MQNYDASVKLRENEESSALAAVSVLKLWRTHLPSDPTIQSVH